MDVRTCTICKLEKHIKNVHKTYSDGEDCNRTRRLKRCYENKDRTSNQQKKIMKKIEIKNITETKQ